MVVVHFKLTCEVLNLYESCDLVREDIIRRGMDTSNFDKSLDQATLIKDFSRVFFAIKALDKSVINLYLGSPRMLSYTV